MTLSPKKRQKRANVKGKLRSWTAWWREARTSTRSAIIAGGLAAMGAVLAAIIAVIPTLFGPSADLRLVDFQIVQTAEFPKLELKVVNFGDTAAFIKAVTVDVHTIIEVPQAVYPKPVPITWEYQVELSPRRQAPFSVEVPVSQQVDPRGVDRFAVTLGYSRESVSVNPFVFETSVTLTYNEAGTDPVHTDHVVFLMPPNHQFSDFSLPPQSNRKQGLSYLRLAQNIDALPGRKSDRVVSLVGHLKNLAFEDFGWAVVGDDRAEVEMFLAQGMDVNHRGSKGQVVLIAAAAEGLIEMVRFLSSKGADLEARDISERSALNYAEREGHAEVVTLLLELGAVAKQDVRTEQGALNTQLVAAAMKGSAIAVKRLLAKGAAAGAQDNEGLSALTAAAMQGHGGVVTILLESRATVDLKDRHGRTALMRAVAPFCQPDTAKLLLDAGADVNIRDNHGRTPLIAAACAGWSTPACSETIRLLVDRRGEVNAKSAYGETALSCAKLWSAAKKPEMAAQAAKTVNALRAAGASDSIADAGGAAVISSVSDYQADEVALRKDDEDRYAKPIVKR